MDHGYSCRIRRLGQRAKARIPLSGTPTPRAITAYECTDIGRLLRDETRSKWPLAILKRPSPKPASAHVYMRSLSCFTTTPESRRITFRVTELAASEGMLHGAHLSEIHP